MNRYNHFLVTLLLVFPIVSRAQKDKTSTPEISRFYGEIEAGFQKNGMVFGIGGEILTNKNVGLSAEVLQSTYKAENLPANYREGFCLFGNCTPKDKLIIASLMVHRNWYLKNERLSFGLLAGPSFTKYTRVQFSSANSGTSFLRSSNYDGENHTRNTVGLTGKAKLMYQISSHLGIGCGVFTNLNNAKIMSGVNLNMNFGLLER